MSGGNMRSDALYAWPTADVSFMAPEAAANVVFGRKVEDFDDPEGPRAALIEQMKRQNAPWDAAGLGLFTDVIDPRETRRGSVRVARARARTARRPRPEPATPRQLAAHDVTGAPSHLGSFVLSRIHG
jgi:acetyl-CoA carboxylase carboxyltransferase component